MICKNIFLVVIYNKNLDSSETLQSLITHQGLLSEIDIIIWDNSNNRDLRFEDIKKKFTKVRSIFFHQDKKNTPLSKVYNYVIENYLRSYDYLTILDHDSDLPDSYFRELFTITESKLERLILPKIIANNKIVSPARLFYFFGSYLKHINSNRLSANYITAINSGMTIKTSCFSEPGFRYNETLQFYGTDDDFMKYYCKNHPDLYVLNSEIVHILNYFTDEPIDKKAWRFHEIMKGVLILNRENVFLRIFSFLYVIIKSFAESVRNKSFRFLRPKWKN